MNDVIPTDWQQDLINLLNQPISSTQTKKLSERVSSLMRLARNTPPDAAEGLLKRIESKKDPLGILFRHELATSVRQRFVRVLRVSGERATQSPATVRAVELQNQRLSAENLPTDRFGGRNIIIVKPGSEAEIRKSMGSPLPPLENNLTFLGDSFEGWVFADAVPISQATLEQLLFKNGKAPRSVVFRQRTPDAKQWALRVSRKQIPEGASPLDEELQVIMRMKEPFSQQVQEAYLGYRRTAPPTNVEVHEERKRQKHQEVVARSYILDFAKDPKSGKSLTTGELFDKLEDGAYEIGGHFVYKSGPMLAWQPFKTDQFEKDIRYYLKHGYSLQQAKKEFEKQWDDLIRQMLGAFAFSLAAAPRPVFHSGFRKLNAGTITEVVGHTIETYLEGKQVLEDIERSKVSENAAVKQANRDAEVVAKKLEELLRGK